MKKRREVTLVRDRSPQVKEVSGPANWPQEMPFSSIFMIFVSLLEAEHGHEQNIDSRGENAASRPI